MSASLAFLSTRWEAKTRDSFNPHKTANLVDGAVNKRPFSDEEQGEDWHPCAHTPALSQANIHPGTHITHTQRLQNVEKNVLLAVKVELYYRATLFIVILSVIKYLRKKFILQPVSQHGCSWRRQKQGALVPCVHVPSDIFQRCFCSAVVLWKTNTLV